MTLVLALRPGYRLFKCGRCGRYGGQVDHDMTQKNEVDEIKGTKHMLLHLALTWSLALD